jgi:hypothetical protein
LTYCLSCQREYSNSNIEKGFKYREDGDKKEISILAINTLNPLILRFNGFSNLEEIGHYENHVPTGLFSYFTDTYLTQQRQYIIVDTTKYVNQYWSFDNMGNINRKESNFFSISTSSDTVSIKEPLSIIAYLDCPLFEGDMNLIIGDFDEKFVLKDTSNLLFIPGVNRMVQHELYFKELGKTVIRGCIDDYKVVDGMAHSRYMYFEKSIIVTN